MICLKTTIFVVSTTTHHINQLHQYRLWFAWKQLSLSYQQQLNIKSGFCVASCDLLENNYLCRINNNSSSIEDVLLSVVICLKTTIFVVSTTTSIWPPLTESSCDLLENNYLCRINNNDMNVLIHHHQLWFAWKQLSLSYQQQLLC